MVVTLSGDNSYLLNQRLKELTDEFIAEHGEMSLQKLDADQLETGDILGSVQTLPFLTERKMLIIRGIAGNSTAHDKIEQIINSTDEKVDLIIIEPVLDKRGKLYKSLQKLTKFEDYSLSSANDLPKWVISEVARQGGLISPADAAYLIDRIGTNQQLLASEINKLCTYEPKINREKIDLLTETTPQSKIFDMLDAAFSGKKELALRLYENERAQRVEAPAILGMLAWQLRALVAIKLASGQQKNVAKDFSLNPYSVSKSERLANRLPLTELKRLVNEALQMDYRSKTTSFDLDEALKDYLVTITS